MICHICHKKANCVCSCQFCENCMLQYGHEGCSQRYKEAEAHFFTEDDVLARKQEEKI